MRPCWAYWASKKCTKNKPALEVTLFNKKGFKDALDNHSTLFRPFRLYDENLQILVSSTSQKSKDFDRNCDLYLS